MRPRSPPASSTRWAGARRCSRGPARARSPASPTIRRDGSSTTSTRSTGSCSRAPRRRPEGGMDHVLLAVLVMTSTTVLCAALVPPSRALARRFGVIDEPGHRKVHAQPMPRLGGFAVFVSFSAVVVAGSLFAPTLEGLGWVQGTFGSSLSLLREAYRVKSRFLAILAGGTLICAVGLADDILGKRVPVGVKFGGQLLAALMLIA